MPVSRITVNDNDSTIAIEESDGTVSTLPYDDEFAFTLAQRDGIAIGHEKDGYGVSVTIPNDITYVAPNARVFIVLHSTFETYLPCWTMGQAKRTLAAEKRDAREGGSSRWDVDGYYVSETSVDDLDVPADVRLKGRDAVMEWLTRGF